MKMQSTLAERHRRSRQLYCEHRVEPTELALKLSAFVFLVFWSRCELGRRIRPPLVQFIGQREKTPVLCRLPAYYIVVPDYRHVPGREYLISAGVIQMVVGVDRILDGLLSLRADLPDQTLERDGRQKGIDNQDARITDHKAGIAGGQTSRLRYRCKDPVRDFGQMKVILHH
jgi:hypothetical protein